MQKTFEKNLIEICVNTLESYKRPNLKKRYFNKDASIEGLLDNYNKDVKILFQKKYGIDLRQNENIFIETIISPYRKQLQEYLEKEEADNLKINGTLDDVLKVSVPKPKEKKSK